MKLIQRFSTWLLRVLFENNIQLDTIGFDKMSDKFKLYEVADYLDEVDMFLGIPPSRRVASHELRRIALKMNEGYYKDKSQNYEEGFSLDLGITDEKE